MAPAQTCACGDCRTCRARERKRLQRERERLITTEKAQPPKK